MESVSETLGWLYSLETRGEIYKLERMDQALGLLGNPHRRLRAVHIAGTKGKGSVAAMLDGCLRAAGFRCGLYTKPHLVNLTERTRVNGGEIPWALMLDYVERLRAIYDRADLALTFFEFTVALMFLYFAEAKVDIAVIETGLGGRLDSTNVVEPLLGVITPIGFDHMDRLGDTLGKIAAEKGGIIKPGVPVVIGAREGEARDRLCAIAAARLSPVRLIDRDFSYRSHAPAHRLDYRGGSLKLAGVELGVAGPFQHENAAIALAALEELAETGFRVDEAEIRLGLRELRWPGRFDIVSRRPTVVLDCAHNELGVRALLDTVAVELGRGVRPRLVFACLEDKQWQRMAAMLAGRVSDVTLSRVKPKRPLEPERLLPLFGARVPARIIREPVDAVRRVIAESGPEDVILVTGSVYLVGEVYPLFLTERGPRGLFPEVAA